MQSNSLSSVDMSDEASLRTMRTLKFELSGALDRTTLPDWVCHRARRLGLGGRVRWNTNGSLEVTVSGPDELIEAMELACSLGPSTSQIDKVRSRTVSGDDLPAWNDHNLKFHNDCTARL